MENKKNYKVIIITAITATVVVLLSVYSCKDGIIDPNDNLKPGRRDYSWTVDTIKVPTSDNFNVWGIWGSSPTDVWISGDASPAQYGLWHYDGNKWENKAPLLGMYGLTDIYGFTANDIWMVSSVGMIWHFDGSNWTKFGEYSVTGYDRLLFERIWGDAPNDIYAVGFADDIFGPDYKGIIMHYNGIDWSFYDSTNFYKSNIINIGIQESSGTILLAASNDDRIGRDFILYSIYNKNINEIYASNMGMSLNRMNNELYINKNISSTQANIYKYANGKLVLWKDFQSTDYGGLLWGRNEKDFFTSNWGTVDHLPGIGHYNGENLITIFEIQAGIANAIIFNNDVFFACSDYNSIKSIIVHGKLK